MRFEGHQVVWPQAIQAIGQAPWKPPPAPAHDHYVEDLFALSERPRVNAANERLAKHLYHYGEQWLTFLEDPSIPATNHRAEQALKTPIVYRKVWGGNRTEAGGA